MRTAFLTACVAILAALAGPVDAQTRSFVLAADERLEASGLLSFLLPRFALKHGIRPEVRSLAAADLSGADAAVLLGEGAALTGRSGPRRPVFHTEGAAGLTFVIVLPAGAEGADHAAVFADWLTGEIGQRTVASFVANGAPAYLPGAAAVTAALPEVVPGDPVAGERLALQHCGRCHVVSQANRFGGIGSTPSFAALRSIPGWEDKFQAFWAANPHPSFTFVDGVTPPPDPMNPPHIAPVLITLEDVEAIHAFAAGIAPLDLGAPVQSR